MNHFYKNFILVTSNNNPSHAFVLMRNNSCMISNFVNMCCWIIPWSRLWITILRENYNTRLLTEILFDLNLKLWLLSLFIFIQLIAKHCIFDISDTKEISFYLWFWWPLLLFMLSLILAFVLSLMSSFSNLSSVELCLLNIGWLS